MKVTELRLFNMKMNERLEDVLITLSDDLSEAYRTRRSGVWQNLHVKQVSPIALNEGYKKSFESRGFRSFKPYGQCEIDFVKDRVAVEVQFGKYAFVIYDIFSKLRPCYRDDMIDFGVEVIPDNRLKMNMANGVPGFSSELEKINRCDIDFPFALVGIDIDREIEVNELSASSDLKRFL